VYGKLSWSMRSVPPACDLVRPLSPALLVRNCAKQARKRENRPKRLPSSLGGEENRALGVRGQSAEVVRLDAITPQTLKSGCGSWGARDKADQSNAEGVQLQAGATAMRA
jgi:hypothetical protein